MPLSCWQDEPVLISTSPSETDRPRPQCTSFETNVDSVSYRVFSFCWFLGAICCNRGRNLTRVLAMKLLSSVRPSESADRPACSLAARNSGDPCLVPDEFLVVVDTGITKVLAALTLRVDP